MFFNTRTRTVLVKSYLIRIDLEGIICEQSYLILYYFTDDITFIPMFVFIYRIVMINCLLSFDLQMKNLTVLLRLLLNYVI